MVSFEHKVISGIINTEYVMLSTFWWLSTDENDYFVVIYQKLKKHCAF